MMRSLFITAAAFAAASILSVERVEAQSCQQWGLKKDPCHICVLRRYYDMLDRSPNDGFPMKMLRKCRSVGFLLRQYQSRVKKRPNWYAGHIIVGHLFMAAKKYPQAAAAYEKAASIDSKSPDPHESLGKLKKKLGKYDEALRSLEKAFALSTAVHKKKRVAKLLIDVSVVAKKFDKARKYFQQLLKLEPRNQHLRGEYARMLTRHLLYKKALEEYKVLERQARGHSAARAAILQEMGEVYEKMGKDTEAIATYRKAKKLLIKGHWRLRELTEKVIAIYRRKNDIRSLVAHYHKTWRHKGYFEWRTLAQLYDELGQQDRAIQAYRTALRHQSTAVDTRDKLITMLERAGRHKEALAELERQVRLVSSEPRYIIRLARKHWRRRNRRRALALLRQCGQRFPSDGSVHMTLADLYNQWGKLELALREYQILVRIEPQDHGHLVALGEQYWQRGKKARALATWRKLLNPGMFRTKQEAYATLAGVYADHTMPADAITMYRKALRLEPSNPALYRALAPVLQQARRYEESVSAYQKVIKLATSPSQRMWRREARTAIISLWHAQGRLRGKLSVYQRKFRRAKPDIDAGYFLGEAYLKLKEYKQAEEVFQRIVKIDRLQFEALLALEEIYRNQFKLDKAVQMLKHLARVMPHRAREFYMRIAELSLLMYKDDEALAYVKKALELGRGDPMAWARIARIFEQKEDYAKAIESYKQALKLRSRFFRVHFALAKIYMRQGEHAKASDLYHEVVKSSPDVDDVAKAGGLAIDLDEYLQTLGSLERELIPLAFTYTHKPIYRKLLVRVYARMIPNLVRQKRFGATQKTREKGAKALTSIGQRALKPLLEALTSKVRSQQLLAIDLLGHLGNPSAALTLVRLAVDPPGDDEMALPSSHPYGSGSRSSERLSFQVKALVAAGRLADPGTVPFLVKLLRSQEVAVREAAAWALAQLRSPSAAKPLLHALSDSKVGVQVLACFGLGALGPGYREVLLKVVKDRQRRAEVRAACAWGVGMTGDRKATAALLSVLGDGRSDVQLKAAWALGMLADPKAVPFLSRTIWTSRGRILKAVQWALLCSVSEKRTAWDPGFLKDLELGGDARLPVMSILSRLEPFHRRIDDEVRLKLVQSHEEELAAGIISALKRHRDLVLDVLTRLDAHPRSVTLGGLTLSDLGSRSSRQAVLLDSVRRLSRRFVALLVQLCRHQDPDVRGCALSVLVKTGSYEAVGQMGPAIRDVEPSVRRWALKVAPLLVEHHPKITGSVVRTLLAHLDKAHWLEQRLAAIALGRIRSVNALPVLSRKLFHSNGFVGEAAAEALGLIRSPRATPALKKALRNGVLQVRLQAVFSLARIGGTEAKSALYRALKDDPLPVVRRTIRRVLGSI